jgi:hypothetical protein
LGWNKIRQQSAADLCASLAENSSLTYLDLGFNSLGMRGGEVRPPVAFKCSAWMNDEGVWVIGTMWWACGSSPSPSYRTHTLSFHNFFGCLVGCPLRYVYIVGRG